MYIVQKQLWSINYYKFGLSKRQNNTLYDKTVTNFGNDTTYKKFILQKNSGQVWSS